MGTDGSIENSQEFSREALRRLIASLVADEVGGSRQTSLQTESLAWTEDFEWKSPETLELDSLEVFDAGARVNDFFRLFETGIEDYLLVFPRMGDWIDVVLKSRSIKAGPLSFMTAGSTGTPKRCVQNLPDLARDAQFMLETLNVERVVSMVPPHHIYGFIYTIWMPIIADVPVIDARAMSPGRLRSELKPGDLVVSTPFLLNNLCRMIPEGIEAANALSSTAPMDPNLRTHLQQSGFDRVVEVYGSSETLGIGWRQEDGDAFSLLPWWRWTKPGQEIECTDDNQRVALQDQVELVDGDGSQFHVTARLDHAVQVGGVNVYPSAVEDLLSQADGVLSCKVRPTNPRDGASNRLKAFIVPDGSIDHDELVLSLKGLCRQALPVHARPVSWTMGQSIPVDRMGKAADWNAA